MLALIICACHAALRSFGFTDPLDEAFWFLQSFQKGEVKYYIEHMKRAVEEAAKNPDAILIFSGGQTRKEAGPISEALSYWMVCEHYKWWGHAEVRERAFLDEFARDSFENLLFSLARFHEIMGATPDRVTVVSWEFKAERFDLHRTALRFPRKRFAFVGANNPPEEKMKESLEGEARTVAAFRADLYGALSDLAKKRVGRNPFRRTVPYPLINAELKKLFKHKGPKLYKGKTPWKKAA